MLIQILLFLPAYEGLRPEYEGLCPESEAAAPYLGANVVKRAI